MSNFYIKMGKSLFSKTVQSIQNIDDVQAIVAGNIPDGLRHVLEGV